MMDYNMFNGWQVVEVPPNKVVVKRSWKERLFTLPWKPFTKTREELYDMMDDGKVVANTELQQIYCNPKTADSIRKAFDKGGK